MILSSYYFIIKNLIESDKFDIKTQNGVTKPSREYCMKNSHLESIHYIMAEFMKDRKDNRLKHTFKYICKPHGVNRKKLNIDFSKYDTESFLKEIMTLKD